MKKEYTEAQIELIGFGDDIATDIIGTSFDETKIKPNDPYTTTNP